MRARLLTFALLCAASGCATHVGPEGPAVGGRCVDEFDCAAGSFCLGEYPDGTCTRNCGSAGDCPGGSICIDYRGGVCLLPCTSPDDCREGYLCGERTNLEGARASVCVGP